MSSTPAAAEKGKEVAVIDLTGSGQADHNNIPAAASHTMPVSSQATQYGDSNPAANDLTGTPLSGKKRRRGQRSPGGSEISSEDSSVLKRARLPGPGAEALSVPSRSGFVDIAAFVALHPGKREVVRLHDLVLRVETTMASGQSSIWQDVLQKVLGYDNLILPAAKVILYR